MIWNSAVISLALATPPSQQPGTAQNPTAQFMTMAVYILIFLVIIYVLMIRPQRMQAKKHDTLMKSLKKGDRIVTNSGIVATVVSVQEKTLSIRSADTKLEILKSAVSEITDRSGESSQP